VRPVDVTGDDEGPPLRLTVPASRLTTALVDEIKRVLGSHRGPSPVLIHVTDGRRTTVLRLGGEWCVDPTPALCAQLRVLLGADAVS
ncbi:MAG: hypothetical protein ACRDY7_03455, partial [Acidimicrobiia bacterium]